MLLQILENNAFSLAEMTKGIKTVEPVRQPLGKAMLFNAEPIRSDTVYIEKTEGRGLKLIDPSLRGEKIERRNKSTKRDMVSLSTDRYAIHDQIQPSDLQFIRAMDSEDQMVTSVQEEIATRTSGPNGLMKDMEATFEHQRMHAALEGIVLDSKDNVIYNYFDKFGFTEGSDVNIDFTLSEGALRVFITDNVIRWMQRNAKGAQFTGITAYCGSGAMDKLSKNAEYREALLAQGKVEDLHDSYFGNPINFAGVTWIEYFGTDDDLINLGENEVRFIPSGTNDIYRHVQSPDESFEDLGQRGQEFYNWIEWDKAVPGRTQWVKVFLATYSLFVNTRPDLIRKMNAT